MSKTNESPDYLERLKQIINNSQQERNKKSEYLNNLNRELSKKKVKK